MKLIELVNVLNETSDELIIFQKGHRGLESEILLLNEGESEDMIIFRNGEQFEYLLEVSIAKQFINDWIENLPTRPNDVDITKRLFEYAINDA